MSRTFGCGSVNRFEKKRELKERMLAWLAGKLGVGPSLGDVYYLASDGGAMEANLLAMGISSDNIFHSFYTAEDALTTGQNDVLCVCRETFTETLETDWDKSLCHVVGLGGAQHSGFDVGTIITTSTATVGAVIHNTGTGNQFHDVTVTNAGAAATALTAFHNNGPGTKMVGCQIVGMLGATACDTALASSLQISANGYYFYAENCIIGTVDAQIQGSDTNAPIYFAGTGLASDGEFRKCRIQTLIDTATRPLIYVAAQSMGPGWVFDQCVLYAFCVNHTTAMNQAVSDADIHTHDILFMNCAGVNITDWKTDAGMVWANSSDAGTAGGIAVAQT